MQTRTTLSLLLLIAFAQNFVLGIPFARAADDGDSLPQIYADVDKRQTDLELFKKGLADKSPKVKAQTLVLLGRLADKTTIDIILPFLQEHSASLRQAAVFALGQMPTQSDQTDLSKPILALLKDENNEKVRTEAWLSLGRLADKALLKNVMAALPTEKSVAVRGAMLQALSIAAVFNPKRIPASNSLPIVSLLELLGINDQHYAYGGLFLSRIKDIGSLLPQSLLLRLSAKPLPALNRVNLLKLIRLAVAAKPFDDESSPQYKIQRQLLSFVIAQSEDKDLNVQIEASRTLISFWSIPQAKVQLGKLQGSAQPLLSSSTLSALAESEIEDEFLIKLFKQHLKNKRPEMQLAAITGLINRQQKEDMSWIMSLLRTASPFNKIRLIAMLKAKAKKDKMANEFDQFIQFMSQDRNEKVANYAVKTLAKKTAENEQPAKSTDYATALAATKNVIRLITDAGDIDIQLLAEAPYTSWQMTQLVKQGFFDGSYFHRVIGNFVAQGGDPIGDGEGSSGLTIREEMSLLAHEPMSVGIATSGKDTGSSQFFINTARNAHLDRNYTIFGRVISDKKVMERLVLGTRIIKAKLIKAQN